MKQNINEIIKRAMNHGTAIPAFNVPYIQMMEPVIKALANTNTFGLIAVARLEWVKFKAGGPAAIAGEYQRLKNERYTRLHLDHVPVLDEDGKRVDYETIIREAIDLGYDSVMVDGSRLPFDENAVATAKIARMAHAAGIPMEAELGAVLGHESGPRPSYEELFRSGRGFTDPQEAKRFIEATHADWLSVAIGNIHGAISGVAKDSKKVEARLNIERLSRIRQAVNIPLVLHGGSGIKQSCLLEAMRNGIAKINVCTTIRQAFEQNIAGGVKAAQEAVYRTTTQILKDELKLAGSASILNPQE